MNLRYWMLMFALVALSLRAQTADAHAEKIANIRKMLTLTGGEKVADQIFDVMTATMRSSAPGANEFLDELKKEMGGGKLMDIMTGIYDRYLSDEDVKGIIQFYESPAGKKMIETTPKIVADTMDEANEISRRVMQRIKERQGK